MTTASELATKLNGVEYPRLPADLIAEAKSSGIVIVYGASDDLMEFEGAIRDEAGAYEGTIVLLDQSGLLPERESVEDDEELERFFARKKTAAKIKAIWAPEEPPVSWLYETDIPHSTFEMMEDGDVYCRGLVFALSDLPA